MSVAAGIGDAFKIGKDNIEAVLKALDAEGIRPEAADVGGQRGRTLRLSVDTGTVTVSQAGEASQEL